MTTLNKVLTPLEIEMLVEIMECENDGVGMGYSEYDGTGLTPTQKGVLGSLVKKEMVYDSYENYDEDDGEGQMWCSIENSITIEIAKNKLQQTY